MPPPHFDLLVAEESSGQENEALKENSGQRKSEIRLRHFPVRLKVLLVALTSLTAAVLGILVYLVYLKYANSS